MKFSRFSSLSTLAAQSLSANIVDTPEGQYLAAGQHQFRSLWTRDFCFAVPGLLAIGRSDVAKNHLAHLLRVRRQSDALVARVLESIPSKKRVLAHTLFRFTPESWRSFSDDRPLRPEYVGEHRTISIDSNPLVLRAVAAVLRFAPDESWLSAQRAGLQEVLNYCLRSTNDGVNLVRQGRYEDWQDSATREGETAYVNLVYAIAFARAHELGLTVPDSCRGFLRAMIKQFLDENCGLLRSHANLDIVSLDSNLLFITEFSDRDAKFYGFGAEELTRQQQNIFQALRQHPLWRLADIPGVATYPDYPLSWISLTARLVGLRHYHDQLLWPWLSALAAKACAFSGDRTEAERIFARLEFIAERDRTISEIHRPTGKLLPVRNWLYVAEQPFSWSAGVTLDAVSAYAAQGLN